MRTRLMRLLIILLGTLIWGICSLLYPIIVGERHEIIIAKGFIVGLIIFATIYGITNCLFSKIGNRRFK